MRLVVSVARSAFAALGWSVCFFASDPVPDRYAVDVDAARVGGA